jgi:hypothetical protein
MALNPGITPCSANSISVNNSSQNIQLSTCGPTVIVWNIGTVETFVNLGTASSTAATTSNYSVPANSYLVLNVGTTGIYLAAITAASTTTLRVIQGTALQ